MYLSLMGKEAGHIHIVSLYPLHVFFVVLGGVSSCWESQELVADLITHILVKNDCHSPYNTVIINHMRRGLKGEG